METFMRYLLLGVSMLVLPLALLLFLQWPLRDLVQACSRQANDLGQILFAVYVAFAVYAASRSGTHLAAARADPASRLRPGHWRAWATLACVAPCAVFMLVVGYPMVLQSVRGMEHFAETLTPGYFVIKVALLILLVLMVVDAVLEMLGFTGHDA
jgi:TRAP-type C4-dicarboxylate transport system permease small subunit